MNVEEFINSWDGTSLEYQNNGLRAAVAALASERTRSIEFSNLLYGCTVDLLEASGSLAYLILHGENEQREKSTSEMLFDRLGKLFRVIDRIKSDLEKADVSIIR